MITFNSKEDYLTFIETFGGKPTLCDLNPLGTSHFPYVIFPMLTENDVIVTRKCLVSVVEERVTSNPNRKPYITTPEQLRKHGPILSVDTLCFYQCFKSPYSPKTNKTTEAFKEQAKNAKRIIVR